MFGIRIAHKLCFNTWICPTMSRSRAGEGGANKKKQRKDMTNVKIKSCDDVFYDMTRGPCPLLHQRPVAPSYTSSPTDHTWKPISPFFVASN